jgi:hypothetical protein
MSTQNELSGGVPTNQTDSISITNSTNFNRQEGWFNISDVTATTDWRLIENLDNTGRSPKDSNPNGDEFYEVAMSFNIAEDWVNLTKVRVILGQNLFGNPEGELYIVNSTSGRKILPYQRQLSTGILTHSQIQFSSRTARIFSS